MISVFSRNNAGSALSKVKVLPSQLEKCDVTATLTHHSAYHRREEHKPCGTFDGEDVYVLTLQSDPEHHATMSALRKEYFPAPLLKVGAHISLFRAIPSSILTTARRDIVEVVHDASPFKIKTGAAFRMARGVSLSVEGLAPAEHMFQTLQKSWYSALSRQDRGKFVGHYTLMNKVNDERSIESCMENIGRDFRGSSGVIRGLNLWRYDRGWWRKEGEFVFGSKGQPP